MGCRDENWVVFITWMPGGRLGDRPFSNCGDAKSWLEACESKLERFEWGKGRLPHDEQSRPLNFDHWWTTLLRRRLFLLFYLFVLIYWYIRWFGDWRDRSSLDSWNEKRDAKIKSSDRDALPRSVSRGLGVDHTFACLPPGIRWEILRKLDEENGLRCLIFFFKSTWTPGECEKDGQEEDDDGRIEFRWPKG